MSTAIRPTLLFVLPIFLALRSAGVSARSAAPPRRTLPAHLTPGGGKLEMRA